MSLNLLSDLSELLSEAVGFPAHADFQAVGEIKSWPEPHDALMSRCDAVGEFFSSTIAFVLSPDLSSEEKKIRDLLLSGRHGGFSLERHLELSKSIELVPLSYRTDEPIPGTIAEIQCPGSVWGEYSLILRALDPKVNSKFLNGICENILEVNGERKIHHLLDNSSRPLTTLALLQQLRQSCECQFFGLDSISDTDCKTIRTHSFKGLVGQNIFGDRLERAASGEVRFDYPPTQIFDQKIPMALPFHRATRHRFSDRVRQHFAPTYLIEKGLLFERDETRWTLDEVIKFPRSRRDLVLKYAGQDTNRNWGSRAVFMMSRFSKEGWQSVRSQVVNDLENGEPWVVQEDLSRKASNAEISLDGGSLYEKTSIFVASGNPLGAAKMYRKINMVHGQPDTILKAYRLDQIE
ncbi:MAG: hypothetical protein ACRBBQ_12500 [Cognatishimia sp.]